MRQIGILFLIVMLGCASCGKQKPGPAKSDPKLGLIRIKVMEDGSLLSSVGAPNVCYIEEPEMYPLLGPTPGKDLFSWVEGRQNAIMITPATPKQTGQAESVAKQLREAGFNHVEVVAAESMKE